MASKPVTAAGIRANQHIGGKFNAEKCIAYLRAIGVEIDDATGDSWLTTQAVHRFLRGMKRASLTIRKHFCRCGAMEGWSLDGEKARRWRNRRTRAMRDEPPAKCEDCHGGFAGASLWYQVTRDGTEKDFRPSGERIVPFDWRGLLAAMEDKDADT